MRPDALGLAVRLAHLPGFALLHAAAAEPAGYGAASYLAAYPDAVVTAIDPASAEPAASDWPPAFRAVPRFIGAIPYEARRDLERPRWGRPIEDRPPPLLAEPVWQRYPAVLALDHARGRVTAVGDDRTAVERLLAALGAAPPSIAAAVVEVDDPEPPERHLERVRAALDLIAAGDLYQVNLCRRLALRRDRATTGAAALLSFYRRLIGRAPTAFGAFLSLPGDVVIASTSPELLLHVETGADGRPTWMRTAPIKGTRPRGHDARTDRALARGLDRDEKERAELTMIVDVERNDLGRVAATGSVRLTRGPVLSTHRTIHHREAWITARARPDVTRRAILDAMVPSGSVTGAPKVRAMEVIARLEPHRRGLYTGGIGFVTRGGSTLLSMAIRTCVFAGEFGEYLTGGGIVAASQPEAELTETTWKSAQLRAALEGP